MKASLTGAFSYTGRYIARKLIENGIVFKAITNHPRSLLFPDVTIPVSPLQFTNSELMVEAMAGSDVFINTYWIRYPYRSLTHEKAVENIQFLIDCAKKAKVKQFIHISVTNPSEDTSLSYFKGKALAEKTVRESGLDYYILRPSLVFGLEDILINNIAWLLRIFPFFVLPTPMNYSVQPVYATDVADAVFDILLSEKSGTRDVVGHEVYRMDELVRLISVAISHPKRILLMPKSLTLLFVRLLGFLLHDRVLTIDELQGLMENRLISHEEPLGKISFRVWILLAGSKLGKHYTNDFSRFYS